MKLITIIQKLMMRLNGLIILRYIPFSEKEKYYLGKELMKNWKELETSNGIWKITI